MTVLLGGGSSVNVDIPITETECEEFDISHLDGVLTVPPSYPWIITGLNYNNTDIQYDQNDVLSWTAGVLGTDCDSKQIFEWLVSKGYILSFEQNASPLVNPNDPFISSYTLTPNGLAGMLLLGVINPNQPQSWIVEAIPYGQEFYTAPSAITSVSIEVNCNALATISLTDTTEVYEATENPNGYGGINYPAVSDITDTEIKLYDGANNLLGSTMLNYTPQFNPSTSTLVASDDFGIGSEWRRNKTYRIEYILHLKGGHTFSCGQQSFVIDQCGGSSQPITALEECLINTGIKLFEKDCSGGCNSGTEADWNRLIKNMVKHSVLQGALASGAQCVDESMIEKLLDECKKGCASC